jgi:hypothetical protein
MTAALGPFAWLLERCGAPLLFSALADAGAKPPVATNWPCSGRHAELASTAQLP